MRRLCTFIVLSLLLGGLLPGQSPPEKIRKGLASITAGETAKKVAKLASDKWEGRNAGYPGCWEAAEWLAARFKELGLEPVGENKTYFQTFTFQARGYRPPTPGTIPPTTRGSGKKNKRPGRKKKAPNQPHHTTPTTRNVVALLPGSDPVLKDEVLVVGGHYDHVGRAGQWNAMSRRGRPKKRDDICNGADDNASGTAVTLEIAEAFIASGVRPKRSILFICFSAEEHGLFGSKHYCENPIRPLNKTVAMLNLDMVGYKKSRSLEIGGVDHTGDKAMRKCLGQALKKVRGLKVELQPWASSGSSDHAPFIKNRVPAVFFFNGLHKYYHTIEDETNLISGRRMANLAKLVFLTLIGLGNLEKKPAFVPASGAAGGSGRLGIRLAGVLSPKAAKELKLKGKQGGIRVANVYMQTAAAKAGVEPGDIILALAGEVIKSRREMACLGKGLKKFKPGKSFTIKVLREGKSKTLRGKAPS